MVTMNMSMSERRKISRIMGKILNYTPFGSEHKQRQYQKSQTELVEESKVEHGKMELYKTAKSEFASMIPYVRVKSLCSFVKEIYENEVVNSTNDDSMRNFTLIY